MGCISESKEGSWTKWFPENFCLWSLISWRGPTALGYSALCGQNPESSTFGLNVTHKNLLYCKVRALMTSKRLDHFMHWLPEL